MSHTDSESVERLRDIIKDVKICMLTTTEADGSFRARPMGIQGTEFDGDLWFFTKEHSDKVEEIQKDRQVGVSISEPKGQRYVSLSGTANLVNDKEKMKELWSPLYKAWFPDGLEDPELALLKVTVNGGEYWDSPASPVVYLFGAAKAALTGKEFHPGEHGKVDLASGASLK